jgi:hypothetical protein
MRGTDQELLNFCREADIDEVMLFFNAEELNSGHITEEELAPWLAMAKKIKAQLERQGVADERESVDDHGPLSAGTQAQAGAEFHAHGR